MNYARKARNPISLKGHQPKRGGFVEKKEAPSGCRVHATVWYTKEFPKIRDTFLGVPILSIKVFWGLYWGPTGGRP